MSAIDPGPDSSMIVEFCGIATELHGDASLDFGRSAELEIDDNPYLHRVLGTFESRNGTWWLVNRGRRIGLTVKDLTSRSQVSLAPGRELALTFPEAVVQFVAGRHHYELELTITGLPAVPSVVTSGPDDEGATISHADLPLTVDQRRLIVALAEPNLRSGGVDIDLPSNRAAALRLGWTITRFNRKLDNVCQRLTRAGVSGLRGDVGSMATERRTRLVEHALESGLVTESDLDLLG